MKVIIEKSPIPLLWLDTWVLLQMVVALNQPGHPDKELVQHIVDLIIKLTSQQKLMCPEADQNLEIEVSHDPDLVDNAQRLLSTLSRGVVMQHYHSIEEMQLSRMIKAVQSGATSVVFPWTDVFMGDPVKEILSDSRFIVSVKFDIPREELDSRTSSNKDLAVKWEKLRVESLAAKQPYLERLEMEFGALADVTEMVVGKLANLQLKGQKLHFADLQQASDVIGRGWSLWTKYGGSSADFHEYVAFLRSETFKMIPSVDISSRLVADLVTGTEKIAPGDVMDVNQISAMLPYVTYAIPDKRMVHRMVNKTGLIGDYPATLIRLKQLLPLLIQLDEAK